jgi:hypothetical protein
MECANHGVLVHAARSCEWVAVGQRAANPLQARICCDSLSVFMSGEIKIPFTESLVGSWLFVRRSQTPFKARTIYHFTEDGTNYWEMDCGARRQLTSLGYAFSGNKLTLFYASGSKRDFELESEEDGSVCFPGVDGSVWWMTRLVEPPSYAKAFVAVNGRLSLLE